MENIEQTYLGAQEYIKEVCQGMIIQSFILVILTICMLPIFALTLISINKPEDTIAIIIVGIFATLYLGFMIVNIFLSIFFWIFFKKLEKINTIYIQQINAMDIIDEILAKTQNISFSMTIMRSFIYLISKEKRKKYPGYRFPIKFLILLLSDLRSDLMIRLEKERQTLENTKQYLSKNIPEKSDFAHISELQKIRLDKQITQFQEIEKQLINI